MAENKERLGKTVRFSIRIPKYQHIWLKNRSECSKNTETYESMNTIIVEAIEEYMGLK